jgi:hypothetical protein
MASLQSIVVLISIINIGEGFEVPKFIGKAYKGISSGMKNWLELVSHQAHLIKFFARVSRGPFPHKGVSSAASYVPDPQEALTALPRLIVNTKSNLENNFISQRPEDVKFYLYEDKQ